MTLAHLFELLPVALALAAAVTCSVSYKSAKERRTRLVLGLGIVCAALLILAQTSWWGSFVLTGKLEGTVWANWLWTVFNCTVMVAFICYARGHRDA